MKVIVRFRSHSLLFKTYTIFFAGVLVNGQQVTFYISNKCPFPIWPAAAPNAGHPVIADGGFFLPPGQTKRIHAPPTWNGRFWARTGCDFNSTSKPVCQTGDCESLLSCNGTIGMPPATLVEVECSFFITPRPPGRPPFSLTLFLVISTQHPLLSLFGWLWYVDNTMRLWF